jgi:molecular chaperone DnaK
MGGVFTKLIERNTTIPTRKSETFSTAADNQSSVEIRIQQGERAMAHDNRLLGVFQLGNIPPAARGVPKIEVTFDIDANGILNVTAKDTATSNEQKITITSSSGLSKDEVEKMAKDAESHGADDRKLRDTIEAKNNADAMVYNVEKTLKEHRGKIGDAGAKEIDSALEETKKALKENDSAQINAAMDRLTSASHKLAESMYKSASAETEPPAPTADRKDNGKKDGSKDNVVDAEFVDVGR